MERMLVVVFDSEDVAYEAGRTLDRLSDEDAIAIIAETVVVKDGDGGTTISRRANANPEATMGGTALGSFLGLLGGPLGLAAGSAIGFALGAAADIARARVGRDFVGEVTRVLVPGKAAVVAEIDEESTSFVDTCMDALGGLVFRRELSDLADATYERDIAALQADIAIAHAHLAASRSERKAKLQSRIDLLQQHLREMRDRLDARRAARRAVVERDRSTGKPKRQVVTQGVEHGD